MRNRISVFVRAVHIHQGVGLDVVEVDREHESGHSHLASSRMQGQEDR